MNDVLLNVEGINIYTQSAFVFLAFLWSSFVLYKKAIEYHESEETIFNALLLMGLLSFVFARLLFVVFKLEWFTGHWIRVLFVREYPGMSGWGVLLGVLVAILIMKSKFKKELFDWMDLTALGLSAGIPIVYVAKGVLAVDEVAIWGMAAGTIKGLFLALWFFLLWWAEEEYRTFEWYRFRKTQARTGFVTGLFIIGFGLANLLTDLLFKITGKWYFYSGVVALGALVVYIRSERRLRKDLRLIGKTVRRLIINMKSAKWQKKVKIKIKRR